MRRRRLILGAAASGAMPLCAVASPVQPGEMVQWPAIELLDGRAWTPASWQGMPAVVVVWATWCPHCARHNGHLDKLHRAVAGRSLRILGVAIDGDRDSVRRYMDSHGYAFPVTLDAEPLRSRLTARRMVPMTFITDEQGHLRQAIPGEMFEADMLALAALAAPARH